MSTVHTIDLVSLFFFSSRRRHTRCGRDWSSDVCSSDLLGPMKYTTEGDFAFRNSVFEIGGRGKTNKQVKHLDHSYVAADGLEVGHLHKIPLWLFGFLH